LKVGEDCRALSVDLTVARRKVLQPHPQEQFHPVLALQRSVGNGAVAAMLTRKPIMVSRCGPDHPDCGCADIDQDAPDSVDPTPIQRSESSTEANEGNPSEIGAEGGAISEATCTLLPDAAVVQLVLGYFRILYPRAYRHLRHYLDGSGADFVEDVESLFALNPRAGTRIAGLIRDRAGDSGRLEGTTTSTAVIRQQDYDDSDWRLSIGGVDRFDYEVVDRDSSGIATVDLTLSDPYQWHPAEDRGSQCLHETMERQKAKGAREFTATGTGRVRLQL
jgi:hypothetical protein